MPSATAKLIQSGLDVYGVYFCLVGDLELALASTPDKWTEKGSHELTEHKVMNGRPKLQSCGNELNELSLDFVLHAETSDIGKIYNSLWASKEAGEALSIVMGDGEYLGEYCIAEMSFDRKATFPNGTTLCAQVSVTFKEYVESDAIQIVKRDRPAVKAPGKNPATKTTYGQDSPTGPIVPK